MCGIVGYIGHRDASSVVLEGLKKLEYRGYDSAGLALYDGEILKVTKTKGKVSSLRKLAEKGKIKGNLGLGHTRWATHGVPNNENSHPHFSNSGKIAIVHNGIIENYDTIKKELIKISIKLKHSKKIQNYLREANWVIISTPCICQLINQGWLEHLKLFVNFLDSIKITLIVSIFYSFTLIE